jgi:two-component system, cell cycle sensor histidine kinase and response regulator CckA
MAYRLQDLIDVEQFQLLQDRLNEIYSFPSAIIDNEGNILTATAWQDICTQFHRKNQECEKECLKSDQYILEHLHEADPAVSYRCPHGLTDNATPIIIDGVHYGNFFTGQFFMAPPDLDYFRTQARKYGFDEEAYLAAVQKVPIWTKQQLDSYLFFIKGLIEVISGIGLKRLRENELRKQLDSIEERSDTILRQMQDGFWVVDTQGRILDANEAMARMTGYGRDELLRMSVAEIETPDSAVSAAERILQVQREGTAHFETRLRRKDGALTTVDVSVSYLPERDQLFSFHRDITARLRAEEALQQNDAIFSSFLEHSQIYVFFKDDQGRALRLTKNYEQMLGLPVEQALGKTMFDLFPSELARGMVADDLRVLREGKRVDVVEELNGRYFETMKFPIHKDGKPYMLAGITVDITERKRAEDALQESEAKYRTLVERAQEAIIIAQDGLLVYANGRAAEIVGLAPEVLVGQPFAGFIHPEDRALVTARYRQRISGESVPSAYDFRLIGAGGRTIWVQISAAQITWQGKPATLNMLTDITERKHAEDELRQALERLDLATRAAHLGIWDWDILKNELVWDEHMYALYGVRKEDFAGAYEAWLNGLHPDDRAYSDEISQQARRGEREYDTEFRVVWPDGSIHHLKAYGQFVRDANGTPLRMTGVNYDLTERKQAEIALRESEERFRKVFEESPLGMVLTSRDLQFIGANPAFCHMLGYTQAEMTSRTFLDVTHPEHRDVDRENVARMWQGEIPYYRTEKRYVAKNGDIRWGSLRASLLRGADGKPLYALAIVEDITEHRRAEEALREITRRDEEALAVAQMAYWEFDVLSGMFTFNDRFYQLHGITDARSYTMSAADFVTKYVYPDSAPQVAEVIRQALASEDPNFHVQVDGRLVRSNGEVFWVNTWFRVEKDASGRTVKLHGVNQDITARKRAEEQLLQAQKMETVGRLAGGVAHDFNNLLTVINGYSELLLGTLSPEAPGYAELREIHQAGGRAASLTAQLLAFSRRQMLQPRVLDLNEDLAGMTRMLTRLIGEDIHLVFKPGSALGRVQADPGQVQQVVLNLVVNARDAMPHGGTLVLETANISLDATRQVRDPDIAPGPYVMLVISDTGIGMSAEVKAHLFEPFFTTKGVGQGTGLGLSTVYGIIKQSGGTISVYSEPGQGTTFRIYLPRVDRPLVTEKVVETALPRGNETILVIEDSSDVRRFTMRLLQSLGYRVLEASSGPEALALVERFPDPLHLVLTDVVMPEMSGRAVAERLATLRPALKVLYMSGYTDNAIVHSGVLDEGMQFVGKPFKPEELARKVRAVLDMA